MARSDQYIGLTNDAENWLERQNVISEEVIDIAEGAFSEKIQGKQYKIEAPAPEINDYYLLTETVQDIPWSSGPMYFTHLKVELKKKSQENPFEMGYYFSWVRNPEVEDEVDYERGHYYV